MFSRFPSRKYTEITWYNYNITSHHLLSRSISGQSFIIIVCLEVEFPSGWHTPPFPQLHSTHYTIQRKERLIYDKNQCNRRFKVTKLWSRSCTHLKSHLILFERMSGKTPVFKACREKLLFWKFQKESLKDASGWINREWQRNK